MKEGQEGPSEPGLTECLDKEMPKLQGEPEKISPTNLF